MAQKVLIIQRIFSHYRKPVYDRLASHFNLLVLHGVNNSGIKGVFADYSSKVRTLRYGKKTTNVFLTGFQKFFQFKPDIVIHEFAIGILSMPIIFLLCKVSGCPFVLWSHGYDRKRGFNPSNSWADKYRLWMMRHSDGVILYGDNDKALLSKYISPQKIFVARNTLDTNQLISLRDCLESEGRENVKARIGFTSKYNLIYIGRLLEEKLPHIVLDSIKYMPMDIVDHLTIHFVGDGPMLEKLKEMAQDFGYSSKIRFHGAVYDNTNSGTLLYASDLMILPGEIGLSVNHALCFQCPVLTFRKSEKGPFHGPEEDYIIDSLTGFKVASHTAEDVAGVAHRYLVNEGLNEKMRIEIKKFVVSNLDIRFMVEGVIACARYVKPVALR